MIGYVLLGSAICLELIGTSCLKYSNGFTKPIPSVITVVMFISCFYILSKCLKYIPLGVAYATWSGIGLVATAIISFIIFGEKLNIFGIMGIVLITVGVVMLNLFGTAH